MAIDTKLTSQKKDFPAWYNEVVKLADLIDYGPVKGTIIFKPYGYAIWENIQKIFNEKIVNDGVENAYFPVFIPESFLKKEKEHVEGFSPELAVVTHAGGEKLDEPVVVRPTSETIMYDAFSRWISSYRDLPLRINQWCNVVRWELRTKPFLRTTEFLWQEGHSVFETKEEADKEMLKRLNNYRDFYEKVLAIPVFTGKKSEIEKFAGALYSTSCEALLKDGKALQAATSHNLGQNFAKPFNIQYESKEGKREYVWQSSWGISTRSIGSIILTHGDDKGLVLPPAIAPVQVIIIPICKDNKEKEAVLKAIKEITSKFGTDIRIKVDDRENLSPGWKFNEWEIKGVPLRIEVGPKDVKGKSITVVRRDENEKKQIKSNKLDVKNLLKEIQSNLFKEALRFKEENTHKVTDFKAFQKDLEEKKGFYLAPWCEDSKCELEIKEKTKATTRVIPFDIDKPQKGEKCFHCGKEAKAFVYFAKAY
ncbi:MAG: proline--tRNA ligase [Patescibacteria group bacterium]|nr:proline--tRNA ligase [Patescibacteria group bacterium]MCL5094187.1 proline--tRNA ligase [Patescibacteria group bacterium]